MPVRLDHARAWRTYLGGKLLDTWNGIPDPRDTNFPEEWIASLVTARNPGREQFPDEGLSRMADLPGTPFLRDWIAQQGPRAVGADHWARYGASLGVLVKLIDAGERLTVQVHPDRETAEKLFHSRYGKTECWYVLGGRTINGEEPCIYLGFRPGVTRSQWKQLFREQNCAGMLACLHKIPVHRGEVILIRGGVPHAIGAGCFLTEIQEPTDYTIRVERTTPSGLRIADSACHQGLGFDRMFDCFHFEPLPEAEVRRRWFVHHDPAPLPGAGWRRVLVGEEDTPYFSMEELTVTGTAQLSPEGRFGILVAVEGEGAFRGPEGRTMPVRRGEQFFVPASAGTLTVAAAENSPLRLLHCRGPR